MSYANGVRGGHASGDLTGPIIEALDDWQAGKIRNWYDAFDSYAEAKKCVGKLWHCTDIVGAETRKTVQDGFNLEKEPCTMAQVARILLNDLQAVNA